MGLQIGKNVRIGKPFATISATDPLTIIASRSPIFFVSADVGTTIATGVSQWSDQSGNNNHFTQATGGNQPALITADADFGGRNSIYNTSGGSLFMANAWIPPAPGTTNQWYFIIFRQVSWTISDFIFAGATGSSVISIFQSGSAPNLIQANTSTVNSNTGAPVGTSVRGEILFSNSTSDYTKFGNTTVSGGNSGNTAGSTGLRILTRNGTTQSSDAKIACFGCWNGEPTSPEKAALDAWVSNYYGGGVLV